MIAFVFAIYVSVSTEDIFAGWFMTFAV